MSRKTLSILVVLIMALAIVPVTSAPTSATAVPTVSQPKESEKLLPVDKQIENILNGNEKEVRLIIAPARDKAMEVYEEIAKIGKIDPISRPKDSFIVATIPRENLEKLRQIQGIIGVWEDKTVKLPDPVKEPDTPAVGSQELPKPEMFQSIYTINAYDTWVNYGVLGDNVTVAVLDTGVDVAHPFLQTTLDGRKKIIDIYDASDEGIAQLYYKTNSTSDGYITVNMTVPVYWGAYYDYYGHSEYTNYTMGTYYVGGLNGTEYYLGLLPERYFDLNNFSGTPNDPYGLGLFGDLSDVYPVLIVEKNGTYTVYIDLDLDNDFTDEEPLTLYDETGAYIQVPTTKVTIVLAEVEPDYGYVSFMWDAHGHGTHVSGTIAGVGLPDDPVFYGVYGVAPNAQLMEVKVLPGEIGFGRTSWIINGMFYAAENGADVISMSLGALYTYNDGLESPEIFYVNYITDVYGVTFSIAAGNEGPTTNTVGSPGNSDLAITVGAFRSSWRWQFFYGTEGVADTLASFSSRGPRMDGMLDPDVIAPGEMIFSSLPLWNTVMEDDPYGYYGIWDGTSMATPHVSGAVALMISYAKAHGLNYNPIMIKRALELSAKPVEGATMIDQGFGLIQVDKAIETLEELSQEQTVYIYGGTTYTGFRTDLDKRKIPLSSAYVEFNSYFYGMFGLPYLYRGVYIRNERPEGIPLYFYPLEYSELGLWYTESEKAYRISTNVDWIIPSTDTVVAGGKTTGSFGIRIDYSKLTPGHIYIGLVYIDDPDTEVIDGFIPVIVDMPMNPNGENKATLSDTALPGVAKHYFFQVAPGTKELRVTLRVPLDENGNPMGRTTLMIAKPNGDLVASYVPGYYFVGPGLPEYTWVINDPEPGNWEITAYTSTFAKARTGYDESHYEIEVVASSLSISPGIIRTYSEKPGVIETTASVVNKEYGNVEVNLTGLGLNRMDIANAVEGSVGQDEWDIIGVIPVTSSDYYLRVGITDPEDPTADLDLYIYYFPTYEDLVNFENYVEYTDQIGPTSYEEFEKFMPEPGYYLIAVYGYDTVGYNPIHYTFYYQVFGDNGDVAVSPSTLEIQNNDDASVSMQLNVEEPGTYLGVIKMIDATTGEVIDYAPVIVDVGAPKVAIVPYVSGELKVGNKVNITLELRDPKTGDILTEGAKVFVNGAYYYANGALSFEYTVEQLPAMIHVKVAVPEYGYAYETVVTLSPQIEETKEVKKLDQEYEEIIEGYYEEVAEAIETLPATTVIRVVSVTSSYVEKSEEFRGKAMQYAIYDPQVSKYYMKQAYKYAVLAEYTLKYYLAIYG
ncbi:pyrolysin [Thermococcus guaymasensis DSM 11113]|uniref:Pyrolysin n=1 Tax=Thermococcus guaymasensis DSM 11113 TaxID=1432656 RepID=A0A0X1KLZ9_9EURY|nr:S8 family serine peptidase [Thermococcus guaymasensis]AJC72278.1 pyrolysin [Thermococcus guaymasensis DSM 11113]